MKAKVLAGLVFLVLVIGGIGYFSYGAMGDGIGTFSQGNRAGEVVKFSHKGNVVKGWEGELLVGYELWPFSVDGDQKEVVEDLNKALFSGARAVLTYRQVRVKGAGHDTDYLIEKVSFGEPLTPSSVVSGR